MDKVNRDMAIGAGWTLMFKFSDKLLGFLSTLILARLLVPADFGLVALAMAVVSGLELLTSFSFDLALIQNQRAGRDHYDTAWTFNFAFGAGIAVALVGLARVVARFYGTPPLEFILYALAVGSLIQGLENIGVVAFRKDMKFGRDFVYMMSRRLGGFLVTVPLAFALRNCWALVIGILFSRTSGVVFSYLMQEYRPRFSLRARADLFHFSKWLVLNNIMFFVRQRSPDFIIGKLVSASGLGIFNLAYEVANLPTSELVAPINRAIFPGYARMSADKSALGRGFLNVLGVIALLAFPAGAGIAATARILVPVALGTKWLAAIPLIQMLAIYGVLVSIQTNSGSVYLALGQPRLIYWITCLWLAVQVPLTFALTRLIGLKGAAFGCLAAALVVFPVNYSILLRRLDLPVRSVIAMLWRPLCGGLVMFLFVRWLLGHVEVTDDLGRQIAWLAAAVVVGAVTYCAVVLGLWRTFEHEGAVESFLLLTSRGVVQKAARQLGLLKGTSDRPGA